MSTLRLSGRTSGRILLRGGGEALASLFKATEVAPTPQFLNRDLGRAEGLTNFNILR